MPSSHPYVLHGNCTALVIIMVFSVVYIGKICADQCWDKNVGGILIGSMNLHRTMGRTFPGKVQSSRNK